MLRTNATRQREASGHEGYDTRVLSPHVITFEQFQAVKLLKKKKISFTQVLATSVLYALADPREGSRDKPRGGS